MTTTFHRHWRDVPEGAWRWPNFSPAETACRGTGKLLTVQSAAFAAENAARTRSAGRQPHHEGAPRLSPPPAPVIEPGVDGDRDPAERHGDEHPAQCVEVRHERQDGGLRLGEDALGDLHARSTQRCHTGRAAVNEPALDRLQVLRDRLGKPLIVRSAYRSPEHNRAVGGATRSKHLDGAAFDIAMTNHDPVAFEAAARQVGFLGFGFYPRSGFMHIDLGPARQWGERFPDVQRHMLEAAARRPRDRSELAERLRDGRF